MSDTTEAAKKPATKKPAAKKPAAKKPAANKAASKPKKAAAAKPKKIAPAAPKRRGRPPGPAKNGPRRGKKAAKTFGYVLLNTDKEGKQSYGAMQGPFASEASALDDAGIMAEENTVIVLFRETKRGSVQKQTRFVARR